MPMDKLSVTGVVVDRDHKDGTKANGDTWDKYSFQIAGPTGRNWYSSFDKASWDALKKGEAFQIFYSEKENPNNSNHPFRNLEWWKEVDPDDVPPQTASDRTSGGNGDQGDYRRSKELMNWIEAVNGAVTLVGQIDTTLGMASDDETFGVLELWAHRIYGIITAGPPAASDSEPATEAASNGPESDVQPPERPEGPPGQAYCQNPEHNNAPLLAIMGQDGKVGHPFGTPDGTRFMCPGTAPEAGGEAQGGG